MGLLLTAILYYYSELVSLENSIHAIYSHRMFFNCDNIKCIFNSITMSVLNLIISSKRNVADHICISIVSKTELNCRLIFCYVKILLVSCLPFIKTPQKPVKTIRTTINVYQFFILFLVAQNIFKK